MKSQVLKIAIAKRPCDSRDRGTQSQRGAATGPAFRALPVSCRSRISVGLLTPEMLFTRLCPQGDVGLCVSVTVEEREEKGKLKPVLELIRGGKLEVLGEKSTIKETLRDPEALDSGFDYNFKELT